MITLATIIVTKYPNGSDGEAARGDRPRRGRLHRLGPRERARDHAARDHAARRDARRERAADRRRAPDHERRGHGLGDAGLARFALAKTAGIPNTVIIAIVAVGVVVRGDAHDRARAALRRGRGEPGGGARRRDPRASSYEVGTYVVASLSYGAAGVLIAGLPRHAGHRRRQRLSAADDRRRRARRHVARRRHRQRRGDRGRRLFLTQLEQVVLGMGAPNSVQLVIQGVDHRARHGRCGSVPTARLRRVSPAAGCAAQAPPQRLSLSLDGANDPPPLEQHDNRLRRSPAAEHHHPGSRRKHEQPRSARASCSALLDRAVVAVGAVVGHVGRRRW